MADPANPETYLACLQGAQAFATIYRGGIGFRFGPMEPAEAGGIMSKCHDHKIPVVVTLECGPDFDWELAFDMRGYAHQPMETAPRDGTEIIGVFGSIDEPEEKPIVWWHNLEMWREALPNGEVGAPLEPRAWFKPWRSDEALRARIEKECALSPTGGHQVDTSMESGPNNCFYCEKPMPERGA